MSIRSEQELRRIQGPKTPSFDDDITMAERNWIEHSGINPVGHDVYTWRGNQANKLLSSPDFTHSSCAFSVWELTGDFHDALTDCAKPVAIQRANQTTLAEALKYMKEDRILVWNMAGKEDGEGYCP